MARVGQDGVDAIFWDDGYGWAVQFRDNRGAWRREYLTGAPVDAAERKWPLQKVAELAAAVVPKERLFVFPLSRNAKRTMQGSVIIENGKVTSTDSTASAKKS
jgi:hypothetical protein